MCAAIKPACPRILGAPGYARAAPGCVGMAVISVLLLEVWQNDSRMIWRLDKESSSRAIVAESYLINTFSY
jgi:hypothetical protein